MRNYMEEYQRWLDSPALSNAEWEELNAIRDDKKEIESRFFAPLEFGTAGLRGEMALGCRRMNIHVIRHATQAFAEVIKAEGESACARGIAICFDCRVNSERFAHEAASVMAANGIHVRIFDALRPTPELSFAVKHYGTTAGLNITASHNPKQWNALKLLNARGEFLNDAEGKRVLAIAASDGYTFPDVDRIGHVLDRTSYDKTHIDRVLALKLVDRDAIRAARFKVVVDAVNSVGGVVIPALLRELGVEVVELNCAPDGHFAHNPEPIPANLTEISARVPAEKADLGIVVDPDVDRLALVCEDGTMFGEEYTLVAVADYVLSHTKGATVSNLSSSRALRDVTERHGCRYYAAAVGEVNVVTKMKEVGAVIGGEGNGGVIYPEIHYGRDALVGVALFLTHLARKGMSASALRATYPPYYISKNKIELTPEIDVDDVLRRMKAKYAHEQVNDIDGVKIDFPTEWVHLRKSNTEPIIRIYSESRDEAAADALAEKIIADIRSVIAG